MQNNLDFYQEDQELGKTVKKIEYKKALNSEQTNIQRNIVDNMINEHPEGLTDKELMILTNISLSSINARRNELKDVVAVSIAIYTDEHGNEHLNTLWGKKNI